MGVFDDLPPAPNSDDSSQRAGQPAGGSAPVAKKPNYAALKVIASLAIGVCLFYVVHNLGQSEGRRNAAFEQDLEERRNSWAGEREDEIARQERERDAEIARQAREREAARLAAASGSGFAVTGWTWENNGIINTYCRPNQVTVSNSTGFDATKLNLTLRAGAVSVGVVLNGYLPAGQTMTFRTQNISATRIARTCSDASLSVDGASLASGG